MGTFQTSTYMQQPRAIDTLASLRSRYSRQLLLSDGFGIKLLSSRILVIGAGGISSSLPLYLAAAGMGHITIVDFDVVEGSNLHRQVIHRDVDASCVILQDTDDQDDTNNYGNNSKDKKKNKAQSAKQAMMALNPTISVDALSILLDSTNIMELVSTRR